MAVASAAAGAAAAGRRNVLGGALRVCCSGPKTTGYLRDGFCSAISGDSGSHVVCAVITRDFLSFTKARGNDLETPHPHFAGLIPGDRWCLCAGRWAEALEHGVAPPVVLEATAERALKYVSLEALMAHAFKEKEGVDIAASGMVA